MCNVLKGFTMFLSIISQIEMYEVEVKVKQGKIIGSKGITIFDEKLYYVFYGVPYAQPPVGKLRFKDPKPSKKWQKNFDARTEYHGACAQAHIVHKHALYGFEDCLHLNIYTPHLPKSDNENLKAIVVWIHGYAFTSSFSHIYSADFLIENDVIFVSVTHRIGAFGFFKLNETDDNANMGLKDIVLALKWIRRNIKKFGGDKKKITIMGSGSAGAFISLLLTTKSKNIFSKLILQSGSMFAPSMFQGDHKFENDKLRKELKKKGITDIMKASTKNIIEASQKIYTNKDVINFQRPVIPFSPIIEPKSNKSLISIYPDDFYKNIQNVNLSIPILIGFNSQESISEIIPFLYNPNFLKSFTHFFKFMVPFSNGCKFNYSLNIYKQIANKIKNRYFENGISEKSIENFLTYTSDLQKYPIYKFIKYHLNTINSEMFVYKFHYSGKFSAVKSTSLAEVTMKIKGSSTGDELCYILKCEPLWEHYIKVNNDTNDRNKIFIKYIAGMWSNFAKTGNPTPPNYTSNVTWLPMTLENDNVLLISKMNKLINSKTEQKMFAFWNGIYNDYYSNERCQKGVRDEL